MHVLQGLSQSEVRTEADQTVHADADDEVEEHAEVDAVTLMAEGVREMRNEREVINGVTEQDGDEIFEPAARRYSEPLVRHVNRQEAMCQL